MNIIKRFWRAFRSAVTGRFVTRKYAEEHPRETIEERMLRHIRENDGA
jgi:hypothetical protein